jgi:hypothetical protein
MSKDSLYADLIKNMGMEIGNVIVDKNPITLDRIELSHEEYPTNPNIMTTSSDCQILLWIKYLPSPNTPEEWNIVDALIREAQKRGLIDRYTDVRNPNSSVMSYHENDRRKNKPLRIF